jgi:hypothetical protein
MRGRTNTTRWVGAINCMESHFYSYMNCYQRRKLACPTIPADTSRLHHFGFHIHASGVPIELVAQSVFNRRRQYEKPEFDEDPCWLFRTTSGHTHVQCCLLSCSATSLPQIRQHFALITSLRYRGDLLLRHIERRNMRVGSAP